MIKTPFKNLALIFVALISIKGCGWFEYPDLTDYQFDFRNDGSGQMVVVETYISENGKPFDEEKRKHIQEKIIRNAEDDNTSIILKESEWIQKKRIPFKSISDVESDIYEIRLEKKSKGLISRFSPEYTLYLQLLADKEKKLPPEFAGKSLNEQRRMIRALFMKDLKTQEKRRNFELAMNRQNTVIALTLPGKVRQAHPVDFDQMTIKPVKEGNTVRWHMPFGSIFFDQLLGHPVTFAVDFSADLPVTQAVSKRPKPTPVAASASSPPQAAAPVIKPQPSTAQHKPPAAEQGKQIVAPEFVASIQEMVGESIYELQKRLEKQIIKAIQNKAYLHDSTITVQVPDIAGDGYVVPVEVSSPRNFKAGEILFIVVNNSYVAFSMRALDPSTRMFVSTRVNVHQSKIGNIKAVVMSNDGKLTVAEGKNVHIPKNLGNTSPTWAPYFGQIRTAAKNKGEDLNIKSLFESSQSPTLYLKGFIVKFTVNFHQPKRISSLPQ